MNAEIEEDKKNNHQSPEINSGDFSLIKEVEKNGTASKITNDKLADQELEHKYKDGEHGIKFNHHVYVIASIGMYIGGLILLSLAVTWCLHMILPPTKRWLTEIEVHGIERLLFSGVIISIAGKYFRKFRIIERE